MPKPGFLAKLKKEGKFEMVKPSEEIKESYFEKSSNSLKAAKALSSINLLEESVSMAYYSMYHSLLALNSKCGIKCENHTGNMLLLKKLYNQDLLYQLLSKAKKERIDKQYYVDFQISKKDCEDLIRVAEDFIIKIKVIIDTLTNIDIDKLRGKIDLI